MSLRELARLLNVSPGTISAVETGKTAVTLPRLHAITTALDTTATELLHHTTDTQRPPAASVSAPPPANAIAPDDWHVFAPLTLDPALTAAITAFVETGYHGATIRTIAQRAGISVAGIYHHYPSKQHLLIAILDLAFTELHWRVPVARDTGSTPQQRVGLIVEALALFHTHRRDLAFIGASEMRSLQPANRRRIAKLRHDIQHILDTEIAAGIDQGSFTIPSPHNAGRAIATMCTSLPQWFRTNGPSTPEQIAAEYAEFALSMLRQTPRSE